MDYKNSNFFSFLLLIIFQLNINYISSLTFPIKISSESYIKYLKSQKETKDLILDKIIKYIFHNKIISSIYIGNPTQKMTIFFNNEEYSFYLSKDQEINNDKFVNEYIIKQNNYINTLSSSFILKNKVNYDLRKYNIVNLAQEEISFDNKSKYNFHFLIDNNEENMNIYYGIAGIGLDNNKQILNYPKFLNQLHAQGIINNYYWSINYKDNKLLIGEENININNNNYQEVIIKPYINIFDNLFVLDWNILFNEIYIINGKNDKYIIHGNTSNPQGNLNIDNGLIIGTPIYRIYLNEKFFDQLIKEKKCFEHKYKSDNKYKPDYYLYSCNKTFEPELRENFQSIKFFSNEFNYTFELNYKDLFISINNDNSLLLFMIVFEVVSEKTIN